MHGPIISERPASISLLRILGVIVLFGWVILGQVLALIVAAIVYDGNLLNAFSDPLNHPDIRDTLLLSQGIAAFTAFIFIPWYYLKFSEHKSLSIFFRNERKWPLLVIVIMFTVMSLAAAISPIVEWNAAWQLDWMGSLGEWAVKTEQLNEDVIKSITSDLGPITFIFAFLVMAVLPAVGEELVFRGFIQTEMVRALKNPHVAIWVSSIFFSAFHLQLLGLVPRTLIGAFLGYLYYWSGNLWIPILGHLFNNGLQVIALYLFQKGLLPIDVNSSESAPWPVVISSLVALLALLLYLKNIFLSRTNLASDIPQ